MPDQTMRERVAEAWREAGLSEVIAVHNSHGPEVVVHGHERYVLDAALAALATPTPAMVKAGAEAQMRHLTFWDHSGGCACGWGHDRRSAVGYTIQHAEHVTQAVITDALTAAFKEGKA